MKLSTIREMYDNLLDLDIETTKEERHELLNSINAENDFYWEADGAEYRIICEDVIEEIHTEELKDALCADFEKLWWIEVDWEKTAQNVRDSDGYGNHFSHYDHSEEEFRLDRTWYYVFRVN
jgi:hypothetical protein